MTVKLAAVLLAAGLVSIGALAFFGGNPSPTQYDIYVDERMDCGGNTPCVPTITAALQNVSRNGRIFVYNGTYEESISIDIGGVSITGESRDLVTVDAGWSGPSWVIQVGADDVHLEELTLMSADYGVSAWLAERLSMRGLRTIDTYSGVYVVGGSGHSLSDSEVTDSQTYPGVWILSASSVTIDGNSVHDNAEEGILIGAEDLNDNGSFDMSERSTDVTITGNTIRDNTGTGLNVSYAVNVTVSGNTIDDNGPSVSVLSGDGPVPLQSGGGGIRFWQTDPTAVEDNIVTNNDLYGIEITAGSVDFLLRNNQVLNNRENGISLVQSSNIVIDGGTIQGNGAWGVVGLMVQNAAVRNAVIADNGPSITVTGEGPGPIPFQSGGGIRFWQTDPSEIRGNTIRDNNGPEVELEETVDFNVVDNTIETDGEGIVLLGANRQAGASLIQGNHVRSTDPGFGTGTRLTDSQYVTVSGNTYEDLDIGILIDGGCHIRIGSNSFLGINADRRLVIQGTPCDVTFAGAATLRFMPSTLNLESKGEWVTLRFTVEGLDPSTFDVGTLTFTVNGVVLTPPAGSPSVVTAHGDEIDVMVKLDRAECIAAFGTSGTYEVTVSGDIAPGVTWSASDTVDAILP